MAQGEWKPVVPFNQNTEEQPNYKSVVGIVLIGGMIVLAVMTMIFLIPRPLLTIAASPVHYDHLNISAMTSLKDMNESQLTMAREKYGMDFSKILTPMEKEKTRAMKVVANTCLPSGKHEAWAILNVSHKIFDQSTKYLTCAMEIHKERFCDPAERQRLVEQLMAYRTLREHLIGYEQAYARMINNPMAKKMGEMFRAVAEENPDFIQPRAPNLDIGKDLYDTIADRVTVLNHEGYINASDFGWAGLVIPREYAPSLKNGVKGNAKCS